MFYIRDTYAKVWKKIRTEEKYTDLRISTSEKDQDGNREYSNWFVRCIGAAHNKVKNISEGTSIKILKAKIQNIEKKDDDGNFKPYGSQIKIIVFDIEKDGNSNSDDQDENVKTSGKKSAKTKKEEIEDEDDIDIPFL